MLHGRAGIAVTLFVFDVLVEGLAVTSQPYSERRALLEELDVEGPRGLRLVATFEDGEALFAAVCDRGLEGSRRKARAATRTGRGSGCG